jgi:small subunit ribosomal protein S6
MAVVKKSRSVKAKPSKLQDLDDYELMVIIKSLITEDARLKVQKNLNKLIEKLGGQIVSTDLWGKKHFAYDIQGQSEGYYIVYLLKLPNKGVIDFKKAMKLNSDIIRYLLIKKDNL